MKMPTVLQPIFSRCLVIVMFLAAGLALVSADDATAQLRIEITEGQVAPTPIAIAEFTGPDGNVTEVGRQLTQIISDDLESSGLFRPVDSAAFIDPPKAPSVKPNFANWSPLGVKGLLVGSAYIDDAGMLQVEFVLWDVVIQRNITAGGGNADQSGLRRLAHQIADFVYEEFTGDSGYFDTQVVYVAESGTQSRRLKRLAIMDQDGHNHRYLTSGLDLVLTPRFSPTANEIAYLNYFNDEINIIGTAVIDFRNYKNFSWLIIYLFGFSPICNKDFLSGRYNNLKEFSEECFYIPSGLSIRQGPLGYQSNLQNSIMINHNSLISLTRGDIN